MSLITALGVTGLPVAMAANGSWSVNAAGNWGTSANWAGGVIADGAGSTANFNLDINADRTITLDTNRTIGNIVFKDGTVGSNAWIIGGTANTLTLDDGASKPTITLFPRSGAIIARIDRPVAGTNGFEIVSGAAPGTLVEMALGNIVNTYSGVLSIGPDTRLRLDNNGNLGATDALGTLTPANYTEILSGGTLNLNAKNLGTQYIKVQGAGVGGNGALVNLSTTAQNNALQQVELTGDATFGGAGRFDIRSTVTGTAPNGRLYQNGFTLTKAGANQFSLVNVEVVGNGNIEINQGVFGIEAATNIGGTGNIRVNTGGNLNFWGNTGSVTRNIVGNGGAINHANTGADAVIASNISLVAANTNISQAGTRTLQLDGNISGTGGLTKTGTGNLRLNGATSYTGNTVVSAGTLTLGAGTTLASADIRVGSGAVLDAALPGGLNVGSGKSLTFGRTGAAATDIVGQVTAASGSTLQIGAAGSGETATVSGNLTLSGTTVKLDLAATPAGVSDSLATPGNLDLSGGTNTFEVNPYTGGLGSGSYTVATYGGTLTGGVANLAYSGLPSGTRQSFAFDTTSTPGSVLFNVSGAALNLVWSGDGAANVWNVGGASNFDGGTNTFQNLDSVLFNDTGSNSPAVNLTGTLSPAAVTVDAAQDYTFGGTGVIDSGVLTKAGAGTLTIAGDHTFAAPVQVNGGAVSVASVGNAGAASPLGTAGTVNLNAAGLTYTGAGETTDKVLALTGGGTVKATTAGAVLDLTSATTGTGPLTVTGDGAVRFSRGDSSFTFATQLAGDGTVILNPRTTAGSTTGLQIDITADNSAFTGDLILQSPASGSWRTNPAAVQADLGSGHVTVESGAQLWIASGQTITNDLTISGIGFIETNGTGIGAVRMEGATLKDSTLTLDGNGKLGAHNGTGTLDNVTITGAGTGDILTIGGTEFANNYTIALVNGTTVNPALSKIVVGGGGATTNAQTLVVGNTTTSADLGTTPVELGVTGNNQSSVLRFMQADDYVVKNDITAVGTNTNINIDTAPGASTGKGIVFSGNTVTATYLGVGTASTASGGTAKLTIESGTTVGVTNFQIGEQSARTGIVDQTGGDINVAGQLRLGHWPSNTSTYQLSGGTLNLTGASPAVNPAGTAEQVGGMYLGIDGTGQFTQTGGAVTTNWVVLDNRGETAGTDQYNLNGGTLSLKSTWGIQQRNSGEFNLGGGTLKVDNTGTGTGTGADLDVAVDALVNVTGSASVFDTNGAGNTITLKRDVLGAGTSVDVTGGGKVRLDTAGAQLVETAFTGSVSLEKTGSGITTLTGSHTFTGQTSVSEGTLAVNGSLAGDVSVASGATLAGTGSIAGATTITGGILSPGNSPGQLSTGSMVTTGTTFNFELGGLAAGTEYDQILTTGTVSLDGNLVLTLVNGFTPASGDSFLLWSNDGSDAISGTFAGLTEGAIIPEGVGQFTLSYVGGDGNDITISYVPEPSGVLLSLSGLLLALRRRRP